jgi:hypothetical protein
MWQGTEEEVFDRIGECFWHVGGVYDNFNVDS